MVKGSYYLILYQALYFWIQTTQSWDIFHRKMVPFYIRCNFLSVWLVVSSRRHPAQRKGSIDRFCCHFFCMLCLFSETGYLRHTYKLWVLILLYLHTYVLFTNFCDCDLPKFHFHHNKVSLRRKTTLPSLRASFGLFVLVIRYMRHLISCVRVHVTRC